MGALKVKTVVEQIGRLLYPAGRVNKTIGLSHDGQPYLEHAPKAKCADGFEVSIQASHHHYCIPRNSFGPWTHVELGYPTASVPSLREYRDGPAPDTDNVFGYVPVEKVARIIIRHGGLAQ